MDFLATCPVITEHSVAKWASILTFGSVPGRIATGSLQSGPKMRRTIRMSLSEGNKGRTVRGNPVVFALIVIRA